jgi:hypothetical protein
MRMRGACDEADLAWLKLLLLLCCMLLVMLLQDNTADAACSDDKRARELGHAFVKQLPAAARHAHMIQTRIRAYGSIGRMPSLQLLTYADALNKKGMDEKQTTAVDSKAPGCSLRQSSSTASMQGVF